LSVVDAFKGAPVLLLIALINAAFIGSPGYYLLKVESYRAEDRKALASLLDKCLTQSVPLEYLNQHRGRFRIVPRAPIFAGRQRP
jgi:hypothetical protein